MEQAYGMILDIVQTAFEIPAAGKQPKAENASEGGSFKDLLQQKKDPVGNAQKNDPPKDVNPEAKAPAADGSEEDLSLAQELAASQLAVALMPNQVVIPEETPVTAAEITPVAEAAVLAVPEVDNEGQIEAQPQLRPTDQMLETVEAGQAVEKPVEIPQQAARVQAQGKADEFAPVQEKPEVVKVVSQHEDADAPDAELLDADLPEGAETLLFRDVETVPIKVAEAEEVFSTPDAEGVEIQVGDKLLEAVQNGESRVEIKLTPEYLGSVTVEISRNSDGLVHVVLSAESVHTQGLLQRHASNLQGILADHGQQTVQVEVQRQQEGEQADNRQNFYDGHNGSQGQQHQKEQRQHPRQNDDFLHQLRLGLIPMEAVS